MSYSCDLFTEVKVNGVILAIEFLLSLGKIFSVQYFVW
jgi:hypothetical protein